MSSYQIEYNGDNPHKVVFEPSFVDSEGFYKLRLGSTAMKYLCPEGWSWNKVNKTLGRYVPEGTPIVMVEGWVREAQAAVNKVLDMLDEFSTLAKILEEAKGE